MFRYSVVVRKEIAIALCKELGLESNSEQAGIVNRLVVEKSTLLGKNFTRAQKDDAIAALRLQSKQYYLTGNLERYQVAW